MSGTEQTDNFYEVGLTTEEFKFLQKRLPSGFALIQPTKIIPRQSKPISGTSNVSTNLNNQSHATDEPTSARREHRPTRVVRNVDHEMAYTSQKLPKNVVEALKKCKNILNA